MGFLEGEAGAVLIVEILDELLLQRLQAPEWERGIEKFRLRGFSRDRF